MKKITTKQLVTVAVLAAIYAVLSAVSFGTNNFHVSVQSLATLVGAALLGPIPGFLVGFIGEFIHQLIAYGLDPTTILWTLPYALEGLLAGVLCSKAGSLDLKKFVPIIIVSEIVLTVLITPVNAISALIQGWYYPGIILGGLGLRFAITAVRIVVYIIVLPILYNALKKAVK